MFASTRGTARLLASAIAVVVTVASLFTLSATGTAGAQQPAPLACAADAGSVSWSDAGAGLYWVYRSSDGGTNYQWLTGTGATSALDPAPRPGVQYQVHYPGAPRVDCTTTSEPAAPTCATGILEAEAATLVGRFVTETDAVATGGEYVHVLRGTGGTWDGARTNFVEFCATVATAGTYRIDTRLLAPTSNKSSFYVTVNDGIVNEFVAPTAVLGAFRTTPVNDAPSLDPLNAPNQQRFSTTTATWNLQPGDHYIRYYLRRDGVQLDNITLTSVDTPDPSGNSPDTDGDTPDTDGDAPDTDGDTPDTDGDAPDTDGDTPDTDGEMPDPDNSSADKPDNPVDCDANSVGRNDDGNSGRVTLPFPINFGSTTHTSLYINNNGNVTFGSGQGSYTPVRLTSGWRAMIAPFWADVDTRGSGSGVVTYGTTTVDGRTAFCVDWGDVGSYNRRSSNLNTFRLVLVDRSDIGSGDFDIIFDYDQIQWDTGAVSTRSAGVGFVTGAGGPSSFFELAGSRVAGAFLDGGPNSLTAGSFNAQQNGVWRFDVRSGVPNSGSLQSAAAASVAPIGPAQLVPPANAKPID